MRITNLATVSVPTTAGGTEILSAAAANTAQGLGYTFASIVPSVTVSLVDSGGSSPESQVPGAVAGTAANSGFVCPAGIPTVIIHGGGSLRAISPVGTATVKIGLGSAK